MTARPRGYMAIDRSIGNMDCFEAPHLAFVWRARIKKIDAGGSFAAAGGSPRALDRASGTHLQNSTVR